MQRASATPPPDSVLSAFGANAAPIQLSGGFEGAWRAGGLVLKRSYAPLAALECEARVLDLVADTNLRLQQLRRATDGSLVVDGWIARDYLDGRHEAGRWRQILAVGDALHDALANVTLEAAGPMMQARVDPWARADRIAWEEEPVPQGADFSADPIPRLAAARRPVTSAPQLVHGDLSGNVLFAEDDAPAVIDFSPYFRPPQWALAVVVADCVVWSGAGLDLLDPIARRPEMGQCLIRAILFRHITGLLLDRGVPSGEASGRYADLVAAALRLAEVA